MAREAQLVRTLVELADTLVDDFDVVELLALLTDRCIDVLDVSAAGIMLVAPGGELRVLASSSEAMRLLELFEIQSQEGPCLDCHHTGQPVLNHLLATADGRWPRFSVEAMAAGFRLVHALPLRLRGNVIGVLNLFHEATVPMDLADIEAAQAFADVATIGILQHRAVRESQLLNEQLQNALNTRVVIEQAKGMVAERSQCNMEEAFALVRDYARRNNLRLGDVARDIARGTLNAADLPRPLLPPRSA